MECPPYSPDLAPSDVCLFQKIKSALKGRRFQDIEDVQTKCDYSTESCSTVGVPKMFPIVAASLGLVYSCSRGVL
jgi:hypothetical protein